MEKDTVVKRDKLKNRNDIELQSIRDEQIGFFIKRQKHTYETLKATADGTTFTVLGDGAGIECGNRSMLLCKCNVCGFLSNNAMHYLRNKSVSCYKCFMNRLEGEATLIGLELIGAGTSGTRYRQYRFNSCGHVRDISTGDVRAGHVSCTECTENKLKDACDLSGFKLLGSNGQYRLVSFGCCGSEREVLRTHLLDGNVKCRVCHSDEVAITAKARGLTVVEILPKTFRRCIVDACGHEIIIGLSNLRSGNFECKTCFNAKMQREANTAGLVYVKKSLGRKHEYLAPCGHTIFNKPAHIRAGHWTCQECEKGYLHFPNKLYLFKIKHKDFTWLKFGYSKTPEYRKYDYKLIDGCETQLLLSVEVPTGAAAVLLENSIHATYANYNYSKVKMKEYMVESGFTECYPVEIEHKLLAELNKIKEQYGS